MENPTIMELKLKIPMLEKGKASLGDGSKKQRLEETVKSLGRVLDNHVGSAKVVEQPRREQ